MRLSTFSVVVTAASVALAVPARFKRGINCPSVDDDGSSLTGSSADNTNSFATCIYKDAGDCTYFFADGSFSSGSSTCPKGLPQDAASAGSSNSASSSSDSSNTAASSGVVCPPVDKDGSALSAASSFEDEGNEFAQCTYPSAGVCAFFFADGSFSSGSSTCPKGLPQSSGSGGGGSTTTTTSAPPPPPVTTSKPPPPPVTTTSTPPPPPPTTTSAPPPPPSTSTVAPPPETTSEAPITSTSTFFSTVQPTTEASAAPTTEASAAPTTTPVVQAPPATTDDSADTTTINTTVTIDPQPSPSTDGGVANANTNSNGAVGRGLVRGAGSALAVVPVVFVLCSLL